MASPQLQETLVQDAPVQMDSSSSRTELNVEFKDQQESSETAGRHTEKQDDLLLQEFLKSHKSNMKQKVEHILDLKKEEETYLKDVYTELFITEGDIKGVNEEHEILQIDEALKSKKQQDSPIHCNDIFTSLRQKTTKRKIVLTKGIAGIGKTISVHKFILDWTEGKANQDIDAMFLLPFREINLINHNNSLHQFLSKFYRELKKLEKTNLYKKYNLAFIFDGLDESRLPFNFQSEMVTDVDEKSTVDELFTNLIRGHLLPSALVWVTSRPAAANQIPSEYVGLFTEVRGFTDQQKEEYFTKRIKDESQASRIISHIKTSRSLYIMCYIPVFCWITAIVLLETLENTTEDIPTTLTEMYTHFLLIQMNMKNRKHDTKIERDYTKLLDSNKSMVLKLAKLAFEQLKNENTMFYEEELKKCGIDLSEDLTESTGMLTEIFKKEAGLHEMKVFCFVHLSVQEFLAALHVFLSYLNKNLKELTFFFNHELWFCFKKILRKVTLHELLNNAVDKAMQSERGHLDLFSRFLLGISLESNQKLLNGLFMTENSTESITKVQEHIKQLLNNNNNISAEASVNLYYCLLELKDKSLHEEIQRYLGSGRNSRTKLSASMCSVLTYTLMMSEEVMDEFNLTTYKTSYSNYMRLIPAVRCCRKAILSYCNLTSESCESVSSALQSSNSPLRELDMGHNDLHDSGVKMISDGLKSSNCKLEILRLYRCELTEKGCCDMTLALMSNPSHIRELDLSNNHPGAEVVKMISDLLKDSHCRLEKLKLRACDLSDECCESLSSAIQSSNSSLIELDMSDNNLQHTGVKMICDGLKSPNCKLETLRLRACDLSDECCESVSSALQSSNSHLIELDMSHNDLQDTGVKMICDGLKSPNCKLETLRFSGCTLASGSCESVSSALQSSNTPLRELDMSYNNLQDLEVKYISDGLKSPNCKLEILRLNDCELTEEGFSDLTSALRSNPSHIRELDLSNNHPGAKGVKLISELLKHLNCRLEKLDLHYCKLTEEGFSDLTSALRSNPSHIRELDLSKNHPGAEGVKMISELLKDSHCRLEKLKIAYCKIQRRKAVLIKTVLIWPQL
ncbi:NACHT, LRR and PYD domains-containing protein 12-like isoform X2 [Triplophysa dalaica]|uniref:NACHT, LRR and PYD domains-containing protein 12-like isoform X2 n=1 Tax=Triplophysa dalaica TaxID=1582913 RepID=UPI0024DF5339|nr:NACHT, LRR and PYD domains-containing protein 12-like isoform X2 [Triplophysa dalaica]